MGLQITEGPKRRHLGLTGQARVLSHDAHGIIAVNDKQIHRQRNRGTEWIESAFPAREIELARRLMNEHGPSAGPDQPGNSCAPAMGSQAVSPLAVAHFIFAPAPIELWSTLTKTEDRSITQIEKDSAGLLIDAAFLH